MSNYQGRLEDSQANKLLVTPHSMANIEDSDTASQIYTVGNMLVFNNRLCKVTAAIAQGDTLEVGTNIAYKGINDIGQQLCASDGKEFYFDVKDGAYGYYPSASKVPAEFVPFGGTSVNRFMTFHIDGQGKWAIAGFNPDGNMLELTAGGSGTTLSIDDNYSIVQTGYYGAYDQRVTTTVDGTFYYNNNGSDTYTSVHLTANQTYQYSASWVAAGSIFYGYFEAD